MAQSGFPGNQNAVDAINGHTGINNNAAVQYIATEESPMLIGTHGTPPAIPDSFVDFVY